MNRPGVQTHGHGKLQRTHGGRDLLRPTQSLAHLDRGTRRSQRVSLALEEEEQRIAAELEQHAVALTRAVEHSAEHPAQGLDQFLAADASTARQLLGKRGEAGDIGKAQGAVDHLPQAIRPIERPLDGEFRDVAAQSLHAPVRPVCMLEA